MPREAGTPAVWLEHATVIRYPGDESVISDEEYDETVRLAQAVEEWAKQTLEAAGSGDI